MAVEARIVIAGAGIAGLAAAIALAKGGHGVLLLERRDDPGEAGAGIQLGPNAVSALRYLGVAETLRPLAGRPEHIDIMQGVSGRRLARLPLGAAIADRHGAPYWTAHRADLHTALMTCARASSRIEIETRFEAAAVHQTGDGITLMDREGRLRRGRALIGADGLHSGVRGMIGLHPAPAGLTVEVLRAVVRRGALPAGIAADGVGVWLAPDAHMVHYPVRGGDEIALVLVADQFGGADPLARARAALADAARALLDAAGPMASWQLSPVAPLPRWSVGRVALVGDAAHPIQPYLAQGGAMALEDATTLARSFARWPDDVASALAAYAGSRRRRVGRVARASAMNGRIYHLNGPAAAARDAVLRTAPGLRLLGAYDWLYGWTAAASVR